MRRDRQEYDLKFTRRALLLSGAGLLAFGALGARLYTLQILESERYRVLSDGNQFSFRLIPPPRGRVLDRFGEPVADNRDSYRVMLTPEQAGDVSAAVRRLAGLMPLSEDQQRRIIDTARRGPGFRPVLVAEDLDWETFAAINLHAPELAGVSPDVAEVRDYPFGPAFSHVLGYVQPASEEQAGNDRLLRHPGFRIGRAGVELARDEELRGAAGSLKVEVNAFGRVIRELPDQSIPPTPGDDIRLTLDADIQRFATERMSGESGATVAMDVNTGEILALVSTPGFDPNLFVTGISAANFNALQNNERRPLFNKSIQGTYPPGSTIKMIVALAALEAGVMRPEEAVSCRGHITLGDRQFHCWRRQGHGRVNMRDGVKTSCDVYFYEVAQRLGIGRIRDMLQRFGLGPAPDIGVAGVRAGIVPDEQWKRARFGQGWSLGETLISAIGQGYMLASPLHLAVMTARFASGRAVNPVLYRDRVPAEPAPMLGVNAAHLARMHDALEAVCHEPGGTSFALGGLGIPGVRMAGKTGTSQVYSITRQEREQGVRTQDQLPWRLRDHGLFVCYAPSDAPKYCVATIIEHGGGGSRAAAPPARDILRRLIERDPSGREGDLARIGAQRPREG